MSHSLNTAYPLFPTFAFLGLILSLLPLPWHLQAWNSGTCAFMIWTSLSCLIGFVNSVVWHGNLDNPSPVWCDISSKIMIGVTVGIPASTLCISRRLYRLTCGNVTSMTFEHKRRMVLVDLCIAAGIPVIVMLLHYVVQGHRFDILEDIGCYPVIYNTLPAYFLYFMWPILLGVISLCYSAMTLRSFWIRRLQFSQLISSNTSMSISRYLRLIILATIDILCTTPLGIYTIYTSTFGVKLAPWVSWEETHYNFSHVRRIPTLIWRSDPSFRTSVELTRWLPVLCAFLFFILFGFASEARNSYRKAFLALRGSFKIHQEKLDEKVITTKKNSSLKASMKTIFFWRRNRLEKQKQAPFGGFSPSRPQLKIISVKWPPSTSFSESKSPTSMVSQSTLNPSTLESGNFKTSRSLDFGTFSEKQEFPIPTYYESTWGAEKATTENFSPTSSTHPTLIGQVIDPKRKDNPHRHIQSDDNSALPDIDESDAFTIDSFTYYEGLRTSTRLSASLFPSPTHSTTVSTPRKPIPTFSPPTPPHPPSPKFAFMQHSLPPPPARKQPRAIGSLTSLLRLGTNVDEVDERGRFSRGDFSFHHVNNDNSGTGSHPHHAYPRSPVQYGTQSSRNVRSVRALILQDVPEDVGPRSYTRSLGDLADLPERQELSIGLEPLKRKEGGV